MRIGILTYHFAVNYGAVLQCYALQKAFESRGAECEICDFQSPVQKDNNRLYSHKISPTAIAKNLCKLPFHNARKMKQIKFKNFVKEHLTLSAPMETIETLKKEAKKLDTIVVGSDQVFSPHIPDFNQAFFLPFSTDTKKVSYAASLGKTETGDLRQYKDALLDFDFLTVREASTVHRIQDLEVFGVETAPDPVFLLTPEQWRTLAKADQPLKKEPYLLCYFLNAEHERQYLRIAEEVAEKKCLKLYRIVSRYRPYNMSKSSICDAGPEDFLNLIANATFVCTDSFHGTVFSSVFGVNFATFCPQKDQPDQRKQEILRTLGLENRLYFADAPLQDMNCEAVDVGEQLAAQRTRGFDVIQRIMDLR